MPSFAEVLYNLPTDRLQKLVQMRHTESKKLALIPNKKQLTQALSAELSHPASVSEAITQCNARELRLLQLLVGTARDHITGWSPLLHVAGGGDLTDALMGVLDRLELLGLAFPLYKNPVHARRVSTTQPPINQQGTTQSGVARQAVGDAPDGVYLPEAVRQFIPASLSDRYTLAGCLDAYDAPSLKRICDRLGLPIDTKVKNVQAIQDHLLHQRGGLKLGKPLTSEELEVLDYLVQSGGFATAIEVANATLDGQTEDFFRYDWQNRWKSGKERNAVDTLLARGLVYVVAYGYGYNLYLVIPGDLMRVITESGDVSFWTAPPTAPQPLDVALPVRPERHHSLLRDVVAVMGYMSTQDAVRTNTGYIHKTHLKNLMRGLSLPEERYASFLYAICRSAGLITTQEERMVYRVTEKGIDWLYAEPLLQMRALVEGWRKSILWGEMYNDSLHKGNEYRPGEGVFRMREAALGVITETVSGGRTDGTTDGKTEFFDVVSVVETLAFRYPLYLAGSDLMGPDVVPSPASFVRFLIAECLYWLGLVELAVPASEATVGGLLGETTERENGRGATVNRSNPPSAIGFRLLPEGSYLLDVPDATAPVSPPREQKFIIQANGEIFLSPYLELSTLYQLLAMTEAPAKGGTGNTVVLTRDSIRRSLDQGEKTPEILSFFQTHSRTGIPQNVEYLINDVGSRHGHIHIGKAVMYLQVDSPLMMRELLARKDIQRHFVRELSETVAVLDAEDQDKLLRDLRKAGYLPVSDDQTTRGTLRLNRPVTPSTSLVPPSIPNPKSEPPKKRAKGDTIDWERIAQDDGKPFSIASPSAVSTPSGVTNLLNVPTAPGTTTNSVHNPNLLRTLLAQAVKNKTVVAALIQEEKDPEPVAHEIHPIQFAGDLLIGYDRDSQRQMRFALDAIKSARLTGERFI